MGQPTEASHGEPVCGISDARLILGLPSTDPALSSVYSGRVDQINFADLAFLNAWGASWGAQQLAPFFTNDANQYQDNYAVRFSGYISILDPGAYNFGILYDDGFSFSLVGADSRVSITMDGLNPRDRLGFDEDLMLTTAFFFRQRWEGGIETQLPPDDRLTVSILIPAHTEEAVVASALSAACAINYPKYEVVIIDDGSSHGTRQIIRQFAASGKVRSIVKHTNQGKAMALNDALPRLNGDVIFIMDADAQPDPEIVRWIMPHFASARVAAVTGNPRVRNVDTFLARLQLIEFTSIVSLLRRSQRIWGRIVTVQESSQPFAAAHYSMSAVLAPTWQQKT